MACAREAETAVLQHVNKEGTVTLEELIRALRQFTFNQVFFAVDRLSREGRIVLKRQPRFDYILSQSGSYTQRLGFTTEGKDYGATLNPCNQED
jgi:DNA-binding transcriptional regulator PaaX